MPGHDTVLLFYREPERPGAALALRRVARPVVRRLLGRQSVSGFGVWFASLVKALERAGRRVEVNRRDLAEADPSHPVGLVGSPRILDGWDLPNPAVLGPGMLDHPAERPGLVKDPRVVAYLVTCDWMRRLFEPAWGGRCAPWYGGIDPVDWPDAREHEKTVDVLIYDKIRWDRARLEGALLSPVLEFLRRRGLSHETVRYGRYQQPAFRGLLARSRAMIFLCEHETQGLAYQEALASNVPVLAWDGGFWRDPRRALWEDAPVPATSVPYFSAECGERFAGPEEFEGVAGRFFDRLVAYEPRRFALRELSLEGSARLYLDRYDPGPAARRPAVRRRPLDLDTAAPPVRSRPRSSLGGLPLDPLTFGEALDAIEGLVQSGRGGSVFTPNVDHVVQAVRDARLRRAYAGASLSLVDGMPLVWASRLLGPPLPEKVSGSDLVLPLMERAARRGWRVYLCGAAPGVAARAGRRLESDFGVRVVGMDSPRVSIGPDGALDDSGAAGRIQAVYPDLVLVGFGAPKQEIWIDRHAAALAPAVLVAVGAGIDFLAGTVRRAPRWMSRAGLEWLFRLSLEPTRLWRRYLVDDPRILPILAREALGRVSRPSARPGRTP